MKREDIMAVAVQKDYLEVQGYTYNERTFDDIFLNKWSGFKEAIVTSESSSSEETRNEVVEEQKQLNPWGEEIEHELGGSNRRDDFNHIDNQQSSEDVK